MVRIEPMTTDRAASEGKTTRLPCCSVSIRAIRPIRVPHPFLMLGSQAILQTAYQSFDLLGVVAEMALLLFTASRFVAAGQPVDRLKIRPIAEISDKILTARAMTTRLNKKSNACSRYAAWASCMDSSRRSTSSICPCSFEARLSGIATATSSQTIPQARFHRTSTLSRMTTALRATRIRSLQISRAPCEQYVQPSDQPFDLLGVVVEMA